MSPAPDPQSQLPKHPPPRGSCGTMIKVAGKHDAYVSTPSSVSCEIDHNAGILFIPDIAGIWENSRILTDEFALKGYTCLLIDPFNGDALDYDRPSNFDLASWLTKGRDGKGPHTPEVVDTIIEDTITYMKENLGLQKLGSVGYSFGAKYVVRHLKSGIQAGFIAYPSTVESHELQALKNPLSIVAAEKDAVFTEEKRYGFERILRGTGAPFQLSLFSGVAHGFGIRYDPTIGLQRFAQRQAFLQAIAWFDEYLLKTNDVGGSGVVSRL